MFWEGVKKLRCRRRALREPTHDSQPPRVSLQQPPARAPRPLPGTSARGLGAASRSPRSGGVSTELRGVRLGARCSWPQLLRSALGGAGQPPWSFLCCISWERLEK